ncbi:MAG: gliding motility-associated protein GldE [Hyphomicrobiales bacterium]
MEGADIESYLHLLSTAQGIWNPITWELALSFLIFIVLLVFSALVSGSEIAYFALSPADEEKINTSKSTNSGIIRSLLERPKKLLATILIVNNFVNVGIVILSSYIVAELFNFRNSPVLGIIIQVVVVTALILLIGEIMPKIYSTRHTLKFARFMARPLSILLRVFHPISSVLVRSTTIIDKRMAKKFGDFSMEDLSEAINITTNGDHSEDETRILKGIVQFTDLDASQIMKSRLDVIAVDIEMSFSEMMNIIRSNGFSRVPVYEESFDNIKGILYVKDLLPYLGKDNGFDWTLLIRKAMFVPENKKINYILQEFREKKIHMAIVVDEYGGTSGIITLEDILEEIVGEISDEFDLVEEGVQYKKLIDGQYIFEGRTSINDFCKVLRINYDYFDDIKGESDSLAGLILELIEKIPEKGEKTNYKDFEFTVVDADQRRIKNIKIIQKTT